MVHLVYQTASRSPLHDAERRRLTCRCCMHQRLIFTKMYVQGGGSGDGLRIASVNFEVDYLIVRRPVATTIT